LAAGIAAARDWLVSVGFDPASAQDVADGAEGLFLLFYIRADWKEFSTWVGSHLGVPKDLGAGIADDTTWSVNTGFRPSLSPRPPAEMSKNET
jgi:hypothetical protein